MPHYYFHIIDDMDASDDEGAELPHLEAARQQAIAAARVLMCETLKQHGRITLSHRIDIENEQREVVSTVRFGDALHILP